jgi:hypothetical protein
MLDKNIDPSETPKSKFSTRKPIESSTDAAEKKKRTPRLYKNHQTDACVTRSIRRAYKGINYTISMLNVDSIWYIRPSAALIKFTEYGDDVELRKAHPKYIHTFLVVSYVNHAYSKKPPLTNNVHDTAFVKWDQYKKWLPKTEDGVTFLAFLTDCFNYLRKHRDFAPHYITVETPPTVDTATTSETAPIEDTAIIVDEPSGDSSVIEEIIFEAGLSSNSSANSSAVASLEEIFGDSDARTALKADYAERLKRVREQGTSLEMGENTRLQEEIKSLRSQVDKFRFFRDGLAEAAFMSEDNEPARRARDQHLRVLVDMAVDNKAESEER